MANGKFSDSGKPAHTSRKKKKKSIAPIIACLTAILVLLVALAFLLPELTVPGDLLPEGITVSGIAIGGMSEKQARQLLQDSFGKPLSHETMTVTIGNQKLTITPAESGAALDLDALIADCRAPGAQLTISNYLLLNEDALRQKICSITDPLSQMYAPSAFALDGDIPALDEAGFDESIPCPALVLTVGVPGPELDSETIYQKIRIGYETCTFQLDLPTEDRTPEPLDLNAIAAAVCINAANTTLDRDTMQLIPGSYGLVFDWKEAASQLSAAAPGQQIRIPMKYEKPDILGQDAYFQDILGFCQTPHSDNEDRTKNLQIACASLNGVVIQPGQTLSYNATLGQRTEENGYLPAPAYSGHELVNSLGGGICQVSSTLYLCSLYAELETIERVNHGYPVAYIPLGTDATVSWGAPDLKLRNDYDLPVKIMAEEKDGYVRIWLMGTETRDYYVRVGFGSSSDGYARNYICKYDRETDEQISRESNHLSSYFEKIDSLMGEIGPDQIWRYGLTRELEIGVPMPETVEASRRCIAPNQFTED